MRTDGSSRSMQARRIPTEDGEGFNLSHLSSIRRVEPGSGGGSRGSIAGDQCVMNPDGFNDCHLV